MKLTDVRLYGHLRQRFGKGHKLAVGSSAEAIRALDCQIEGFGAWVVSHGSYKVLVGEEAQTLDTLGNPVGGGEVIKIVPVVAGASDGVQIIVGAALIAVGVATGFAPATNLGIAMVLGGVAQMLAITPVVGQAGQNGPSDMPSYSFGSPTVTIGQGRPVPVLYGQLRVGGAIVSAGIVSEGYQSRGFGGQAPDDAGTIGGNGDTLPWVAAVAAA